MNKRLIENYLSTISAASLKIESPVVFFPGTLCDERVFQSIWPLIDIPMRAFVPLQWAEDLSQMKMLAGDRLAYFEEKVHLVGFSMGGYLAVLTALENSERIASVTLIGNVPSVLSESELKDRKHTLSLIKNKQYKAMPKQQLARLFHPNSQENLAAQSVVQQMEQDLGVGVLAMQYHATNKRSNLLPKLAQADFFVNSVAGEADYLHPLNVLKAMQQKLPRGKHKIIENAGHMLPLEKPEILANWLACTLNS